MAVISAPAPEAELEVSISLPAAAPLLALQGKDAVMRAARIEGSAEFAETLGFVIRNLRWDAEEDLSKVVGDIAAHRIAAWHARICCLAAAGGAKPCRKSRRILHRRTAADCPP